MTIMKMSIPNEFLITMPKKSTMSIVFSVRAQTNQFHDYATYLE